MSATSKYDVPSWIKVHSELQSRGIGPPFSDIKPAVVYRTGRPGSPIYVVKILNLGPDPSEESEIVKRLQHDHDPRNPLIPCEVLESGPQPILLMPYLMHVEDVGLVHWPLSNVLAAFLQVVKGVEYLHERKIAHLDICDGNTLIATPHVARRHSEVVEGKIYLIDFQTSRQLLSGPGLQRAITLPVAHQVQPPFQRMDPYSWDVYCLGKLLDYWASRRYRKQATYPRLVYWIRDWLVGDEQGCTDVCRCRPTARRARQVLSVLRWFIRVSELCEAVASQVYNCVRRTPRSNPL
ncbi:hypothetical protein C8Q77DRAFT_1125852 [Trametes polyzona]|nr:hypothetical protein C8Q77DRAFT_1125852 [Trametes polyzona]